MGESLYRFLARSIPSGWMACWRWRDGRPMLALTLIQLGLAAMMLLLGGVSWFLVFLVQGVVTLLLLKWINYVEHYGLYRKMAGTKLEPISDHHSWDSANPMTNWCLFNLGFHSQHHRNASTPYFRLPESKKDWNLLPLGYANMMMAALIPPVFKGIMQPLLDLRK
jgi:alkane 1-monooxygenase